MGLLCTWLCLKEDMFPLERELSTGWQCTYSRKNPDWNLLVHYRAPRSVLHYTEVAVVTWITIYKVLFYLRIEDNSSLLEKGGVKSVFTSKRGLQNSTSPLSLNFRCNFVCIKVVYMRCWSSGWDRVNFTRQCTLTLLVMSPFSCPWQKFRNSSQIRSIVNQVRSFFLGYCLMSSSV
jgi:hypothetical protein